MDLGFYPWVLLASASSLGSALLAVAYLLWAVRADARRRVFALLSEPGDTVFLFEGDALIEASPGARALLARAEPRPTPRAAVEAHLQDRFPGIAAGLRQAPFAAHQEMLSQDGTTLLEIDAHGQCIRVALTDTESIPAAGSALDRGAVGAMERELETLRAAVGCVPIPIWRQAPDGTVPWANKAYLDLLESPATGAGTWPFPNVFGRESLALGEVATRGHARRIKLSALPERPERWYEAHAAPVGEDLIVTAIEADAVIAAEASLRDFVQTLSKTFATLTIGLAVFNKDRRLALFNPALGDLTTLPAEFLLSQPSLYAFLDSLRDRNMVPEPKDYRSWRASIANLERSASNGTYSETWHLPFGQTYRITGAPQPDGAVALLFEDISSEITLSRRFNTVLERAQSVLDQIDEAIAVFDASGILIMTNTAYDALWGVETREGFAQITVDQAFRHWVDTSSPTPIWAEVRDFVKMGSADRPEWSGEARLTNGKGLTCRAIPLTGGVTMMRFNPGPRSRPRSGAKAKADAGAETGVRRLKA